MVEQDGTKKLRLGKAGLKGQEKHLAFHPAGKIRHCTPNSNKPGLIFTTETLAVRRIDENAISQLLLSNKYPKMVVAYNNKCLFLTLVYTCILAKNG